MEEKTIYYISEAAKKVQVESHVLRYWEEELELPIRRNEMGHRCYTEQDIKKLQEIKQLKEQGLQLKAIRTVLFRMPDGISEKAEDIFMQQVNQTVMKTEEDAERKEQLQKDSLENGEEKAVEERNTCSDEKMTKAPEKTGTIARHMDEVNDKAMESQNKGGTEEIDIDKPRKFIVALSKDKEEAITSEPQYDDADKSRKAARLQYLLQHMITEAVRSANKELCTDVKESILKELDYQFRMQEERDEERWKKEEEHYRKIDEMIRERHKPKDRLGRGKKKSPAKDDPINF